MQKRKLGKFGLEVSALGLGCMGMSWAYGTADRSDSMEIIKSAVRMGVTFLDTADVYGNGSNEELVGGLRDQVVLATKCGISGRSLESGFLEVNGRPDYIKACCEASLGRLRTDCIDLFYLHRVDPDVPIKESVGALKELVEEGKVRYIGLSEAGPDTLRKACEVAPISVLQSEYSLWTRGLEKQMLPLLKELSVGLVPYSPLGRGFLSGKIRSIEDLEENDFRRTQPRFAQEVFESNLLVVKLVEEIAQRKSVSAAQIALAWLLHRGDDIAPIPGTKRMKYLTENAASIEIELSSGEMSELNEVSGKILGERYTEALMKAVSL